MKPIALALAAACWCLAVHAQEPSAAARPDVARDCNAREAELRERAARISGSQEEMNQEGARLTSEGEEIGRERRRAEEAGPDQVAAYNARRAEFNQRLAAHNERVSALNAQVTQFNAESDAATTQCNRSLRLTGAAEPKLDEDERAVLAAALAQRLAGSSGPVMLEDHTANFLCSRSLPDVMQFDGCSGLRRPHETPQEVVAKLRRAWPGVSDAALADLATKGDQRARIEEPLELGVPQVLRGYGEGASGERVDASIKVSRVGFDAARREAVAFVAVRSKGRSTAEYLRLERSASGWTVTGRTAVP
jgi:hypothetical protein